MTKKEILENILKEKFVSKAQQKYFYAMANKSGKEGKKWKEMADEFSSDTDYSEELPQRVKKKKSKKESINPKMKKTDLVEYVKTSIIKEQTPPRYGGGDDPYNFPFLREVTHQERRDIMKYFEMLRQSGIINMFGSHPLLNWTKDDLHRFLYGEKNDPESIEREIEEEEYDNEDGENDNTISMLEDKLEKINYLLDNKRKMRDVLIRAALNRIDNTDGNHETRNVQRVFEKMAKEAWHFWVGIQQI
tara:strand:+ start:1973 stop:2713 length:741 start_codon:yes stop_codon:yes gene_type:complete